jgi:uncharacterized protein
MRGRIRRGEVESIRTSGAPELEGRYRRGAGTGAGSAGVVICHPHPQFGGSMDNNVVEALEDALSARGLATLAFNFRGVGESGGGYDQMRGEVDDVVAALMFLAKRPEIDANRLGLAGYSFGGLMAMLAAARLAGSGSFGPGPAALVSPMAAARPWESVAELRPFYDRPGSTLVITGTADPFCPVKSARDLSVQLGMNARMIIAEGVDHFWAGREAEAAEAAADFFSTALRSAPLSDPA